MITMDLNRLGLSIDKIYKVFGQYTFVKTMGQDRAERKKSIRKAEGKE